MFFCCFPFCAVCDYMSYVGTDSENKLLDNKGFVFNKGKIPEATELQINKQVTEVGENINEKIRLI